MSLLFNTFTLVLRRTSRRLSSHFFVNVSDKLWCFFLFCGRWSVLSTTRSPTSTQTAQQTLQWWDMDVSG